MSLTTLRQIFNLFAFHNKTVELVSRKLCIVVVHTRENVLGYTKLQNKDKIAIVPNRAFNELDKDLVRFTEKQLSGFSLKWYILLLL